MKLSIPTLGNVVFAPALDGHWAFRLDYSGRSVGLGFNEPRAQHIQPSRIARAAPHPPPINSAPCPHRFVNSLSRCSTGPVAFRTKNVRLPWRRQ